MPCEPIHLDNGQPGTPAVCDTLLGSVGLIWTEGTERGLRMVSRVHGGMSFASNPLDRNGRTAVPA